MAINSIVNFIKTLKKFPRDKNFEYFYRGHSNHNFLPLPTVYRKSGSKKISPFAKNEDKIFREVIIRTPSDFTNERTALEKLVKMQHYGLPTRILDITSNPLVALHFACHDKSNENDGEVLVFKIPKDEVKYYDSDTVSILSNLSKRPIDFDITEILERYLKNEAKFPELNSTHVKEFNEASPIPYLLHEIREEKPHFMPIIDPLDFNKVLAVRVKLNNNRILKQSGAFLLFGMNKSKSEPAELPKEWVVNKSFKHFDLKISSNKKELILKDLDAMGINESTLYPELEKQTDYITKLFSH